jgi:MarR family transcriptional regulator, lower aerobic nicotinate degradation pathway regulator
VKSPPSDDLAVELAAHPGYLIRRAQQVSVALFNEAFGRYGITPTQALCLHAIQRRPGIDQMAVARLIEIDHATAAMVIAGLAKAGYITRVVDPNDRRRRTLAVTRKGTALTKRMGAFSESAAQLLTVFPPREAQAFVALLSRFVEQHGKTLSA